jgi:hypothetical protein
MKFKVIKSESWWGEGYQFEDGTCAIRWYGDIVSTVFYSKFEDVKKIHGNSVQEI